MDDHLSERTRQLGEDLERHVNAVAATDPGFALHAWHCFCELVQGLEMPAFMHFDWAPPGPEGPRPDAIRLSFSLQLPQYDEDEMYEGTEAVDVVLDYEPTIRFEIGSMFAELPELTEWRDTVENSGPFKTYIAGGRPLLDVEVQAGSV